MKIYMLHAINIQIEMKQHINKRLSDKNYDEWKIK